ncbi:MAG TPA: N-acetylneuraminate synthase family protein [Myxococcota bacterium]|nr:N-acetylneuraminate synthase family protein [Myxococcota bacterium]
MKNPIRIGERLVGDGAPCFVVAEAGSNHNGSLEQARALVRVAARAGADAVKFQTFKAARLYTRSAGKSDYLGLERSIYDVIAEMEMPDGWIPLLAQTCRDEGVVFFSAPFDEHSADLLDPYVPVFKIASYEMTHHPLVQHVAAKGKPVIMSTGTASLDEVSAAVDTVRGAGNDQLVLLQCTASYPAPPESINVRALATMASRFGVPAGLSDHSADALTAPMAAVALGAAVIEKHFTLSRALPGPDHPFAVEPDELAEMVRRIRAVEKVLGDGAKQMHPVEAELHGFARRSIFTTRAIDAGERLDEENVAVLRCGNLPGRLPPAAYPEVLGRRARRALAAEAALALEDME